MRREKSGLTVIEILVVVSIIAILVGILVPALTMVRNSAKQVKQHAQFTAIDLGLAAFRGDYGDYPPSSWWNPATGGLQNYCGAQKLAESLLGWDLLGFHPDSAWRADGLGLDPVGKPVATTYTAANSLDRRKDRYIELDTANVFQLGRLFVDSTPLAPNTYVVCDVFEVPERKMTLPGGSGSVVPGTPILYYCANRSSKTIDWLGAAVLDPQDRIYNIRDNAPLVSLGRLADGAKPLVERQQHPLDFYSYIRDPKVQARAWPYRPDSYILISAGPDGLYGTDDDICNFGKR